MIERLADELIASIVPIGTGPKNEFWVFFWIIILPVAFVGFLAFGVVRHWREKRRGPRRWSRRPSYRKSSGQRRRRPPSTGTGRRS